MPKNREKITNDQIQERSDKIKSNDFEIQRKLTESLFENDQERLREIDQEIRNLQLDSSLLKLEKLGLEQFQAQQGKQAEATKIIREIQIAHDRVETLLGRISDQADKIEGMRSLLEDNKTKFGQFKEKLETYVDKTYPNGEALNKALHGGGLFLSLAGLVFGIACLVYAVNGAKSTKTTPVFKESGNSASPGMDVVALGEIPRDPKDMNEDQLEELMQKLIVDRGVIASGEVPQKRLWQNLAGVADKTEIEDQDLALILLQEAASGLPGTREFLWLDPSEAKEQYDALRAAYKKSEKLSDVYLAATKIEYNGEEVPTFHTALLLQCALDRIHHDSLFPDVPTPAVA